MTGDERYAFNEAATSESLEEQREFQASFRSGDCYLCGGRLDTFDAKRPCLHWLLRPKGVKKSHISDALSEAGAMQAQTYLRWVATEEAPIININDLPDGSDQPKPIEVSIRYKDLEWSFSCGHSDLKGHGTGYSAFPHFHFQMRICGRPFINYNDFHIPLKHNEIVFLYARQEDPRLTAKFPGGWGMADVLNESNLEKIVDLPVSRGDRDRAPFHMGTMIMAKEGTTISGDALANMFRRSQSEGRSLASLARELPNVRVMTEVSAGPGVVEAAVREGGRGNKNTD